MAAPEPADDPFRWDERVDAWEEVAASQAFAALRERIATAAAPAADDVVVDVGAGTGLLTLALAPRCREVIAVDISPAMLERLEEHAASAGIGNVRTVAADARALPLEDESATLAVSNYAFHHLTDPDKELALAEIRRVLVPGARLVVCDMMFSLSLRPRDRRLVLDKIAVMARRGPAGWLRVAKNAGRVATGRWERPAPPEVWRSLLTRRRFEDVEIELLEHEAGLARARRPPRRPSVQQPAARPTWPRVPAIPSDPTNSRASREDDMALQLGDTAPDFEAETTEGKIRFHDWIGDSWAVLFSHPRDFTPVCTTELGYMARIKPEFDKRGVKIIGLSVDPVDNHEKWSQDIAETQGTAPNYPMIGDVDFNVSKLYGMLPADVAGDPTARTAADNQTVRNVFVIGPDKKIKLILVYPMTTGRNFDEVLRVIDSLQLTAKHRVATPAQWKQGDSVIIAGSVSDDEAKEIYPDGWESPRPYIRIVPQPST